MRGYKVFDSDWKCRGFQYKAGETFEMDEEPILCERGFHFCEQLIDCWDYKNCTGEEKIAEVEALGEVASANGKSVTNKIKIIREISAGEMLIICYRWIDSLPLRGFIYKYAMALQEQRVLLYWSTLSSEDKSCIRQLPNFDGDKFSRIMRNIDLGEI